MILLKFTELLIYAEPKKFEFLGQYEKPWFRFTDQWKITDSTKKKNGFQQLGMICIYLTSLFGMKWKKIEEVKRLVVFASYETLETALRVFHD
jgi:hypothetical protein